MKQNDYRGLVTCDLWGERKKVETLRKHAYLNILKISPPKTESFHIKILLFFIFQLMTKTVEVVLTSTHNLCFEQK